MTKRRLVTVWVLVGLTELLVAQSPPPPTPPGTAQEKQSVSEIKNQPPQRTSGPPATLTSGANQSPTTPTRKAADQQANPDGNKAPFSWGNLLTVIFTGVLTGVGILQWISMSKQADYMRRGLPVSIKAARSARFSARAAKQAVDLAERNTAKTERAIVLIDDVNAQPVARPDDYYINGSSLIAFTLKNFGDTAAHSVKLKGEIKFQSGSMNIHDWPESTIPPQGLRKWITSSLLTRIKEPEIRGINFEDGKLRYAIEVTYTDVFGNAHRYKAEGQYIPLLRQFVVISSTSD